MKTKILLIVTLLLVVYSCKTTKQVDKLKQQTATSAIVSTDNTESSKVKVNELSEIAIAIKTITSDKGIIKETIEETTTRTKYSAPDSTGKQYVLETETTKRETKNETEKNLQKNSFSDNTSNKKISQNSESEKEVKTKTKIQTELSQEQKTSKKEKTEIPAWVYVVATIFCFVILVIILRVLKHYKILK